MANLARQHAALKDEIEAAALDVLRSGRYVGGPAVESFEAALAVRLGRRHAVGTSSGTTALHTALCALGVGPGDEVVVPAYTFCATAEAVLHCGATPRLADVDAHGNLDPAVAEHAITPATRAIVVVHLFGRPAEVAELRAIARAHDLWLVEDCAQALGADGLGAADAACFSFFPAKILGAAGDAGAVACDDDSLAVRMRLVRNHGRACPDASERLGYNYRLDALQAAILAVKLRHLDVFVAARRRIAARYREALADLPLELPGRHHGHVYQAFTLLSDARDQLATSLRSEGIATATHYHIPLHRQRAFAELPRTPLPRTEALAARALCLPLYAELEDAEVEQIIAAVRRFFQSMAQCRSR